MRSRLALICVLGALIGSPAVAAERFVAAESAKACPKFGPGFFEIPGTTTCIRIGGRVAAEAGTGTRRIAREGSAGTGVSARLFIDTRTDTDYGPLRLVWSARAGDRTGHDPGPR